jgi:RNA polymerase sigma-70 factor (ECF subfamily)
LEPTRVVAGRDAQTATEEVGMGQKETLSLGFDPPASDSRWSLQQVFDTSYRRLVVQLYAVTGNAGEAEDLVQDAFVRASASGKRFQKVDNPEAWLRRTAINLHRNRWRKLRNFNRIRPKLETRSDLPGIDQHLIVVDALRRLPEHQREVLALHYLADLPVAEIASTLGVPEGTVKTRLMRGREALAAQLGDGSKR